MSQNTVDKIIEECQSEQIDWIRLEALVDSICGSINDRVDDDETILSLAITECGYGSSDGKKLDPLIRLFAEKGYDVHANNEFNGGICLHNLCWSTYSSDILDAAVLLLDLGADPFYVHEDEDDGKGILGSISGKLDYWTTGDLPCANLFEAYYAIIEAAQNNRDYHGIHTFSMCVGKKITKISQLSFNENDAAFNQDVVCYKGAVVIWCGNIPLVVDCAVDFVVNPLVPPRAVKTVDISEAYSEAIGREITGLTFLSANIAELRLDDNLRILFGNNHMGGNDDYYARMQLERIDSNDALPMGQVVDRVYFRSGVAYSGTCTRFDEDVVFLSCDDCLYLICSIGEDYSEHQLICRRFSKEWFSGLRRTLQYADFHMDEVFYNKDGTQRGVNLHCTEKYLYLLATEFSGVKVMLESQPISDVSSVEYYTEGERIEFILS